MAQPKELDQQLIKTFYESGLSTIVIGKIMECNPSSIWWCLKRMRVPMRSLSQANKASISNPGKFHSSQFPHRSKQNGYIYIWMEEHPKLIKSKPGIKGGYVAEHLLVWEKANNQSLPEGHSVHHLNGIKDDNRPENLVAMKHGEHVHQTEPFIKRIKELEDELSKMRS